MPDLADPLLPFCPQSQLVHEKVGRSSSSFSIQTCFPALNFMCEGLRSTVISTRFERTFFWCYQPRDDGFGTGSQIGKYGNSVLFLGGVDLITWFASIDSVANLTLFSFFTRCKFSSSSLIIIRSYDSINCVIDAAIYYWGRAGVYTIGLLSSGIRALDG